MTQVSIFNPLFRFRCNDSIDEVIKAIAEGKFKEKVINLRGFTASGKQTKADQQKKSLPAFTPSGTFKKHRRAELLDQYSQFIILDIDKLPTDQLEPVFKQASALPTTYCCFLSPSGNGIKILVKVTSGAENHTIAFNQVVEYYEAQLQVTIDRSGVDVSRLCFLSYDPDLYLNKGSQAFQVQVVQQVDVSEPTTIEPIQASDYPAIFSKAVEFTMNKATFANGGRNRFIYILAINCSKYGIPQQEALKLIQKDFNYNPKEVISTTQSAYKKTASEFGSSSHLAQNEQPETDETEILNEKFLNTPCIPDEVYQHLPSLLKSGTDVFQARRERDTFLTGALAVLSGCLNSIWGTYDQRTVYTNIYVFIIAPPASGKGAMTFSKELAMALHRKIKQENKEAWQIYHHEMRQYRATMRSRQADDPSPEPELPKKPKNKVLLIPANSSSAAVISLLEQSDGAAIICETEADTMGNSFKQDWGGYSDLLRKAFHHEPVSLSRKTNNEFLEVENTRISLALSGTPSQVQGLITSSEDGLFSRIIFYAFKVKPVWRDVSPQNFGSDDESVSLTDHFKLLSQEVLSMVEYLDQSPTEFRLTDGQWEFLNRNFSQWLQEVSVFVNEDATSTVKRLGLIVFRIAMTLTAIRKFEGRLTDAVVTCSDVDFQSAVALSEVYKEHAILMFSTLKASKGSKLDHNLKSFFDALPDNKEFTRQQAIAIGQKLGIKERTVAKYLKNLLGSFLQQPIKYGHYRKK